MDVTQVSTQRRPRPWWVAMVAGLASYIDAASITGFATTLVIFQSALGLSPAQVGAASACLTASIATGALIGGRAGDRVGRRPIFLGTMVMIAAAAATMIVATDVITVLVAACVLGFGVGADLPVSLAAIAEAATDSNRGKLLVFSNLLWILGVVANNVLSAFVGDLGRVGAQIIFAHVLIACVVALIGRILVPESALWMRARERPRSGHSTKSPALIALRALMSPQYRTPLLSLIVFYSLTNVVANTSGQFGRYVLVNFGGVTVAQASVVALSSMPVVVACTLWFMRVVDTSRRLRYFVIGGCCAVAAPLIIAVLGVGVGAYVTSIVVGAVGVAFAFEGIMKVWTQESFPTLIRSTAQGLVIGVARFAAAAFAAVTPLLLHAETAAVYVLLAVCQATGLLAAWVVFRRRSRRNEFQDERAA